MWKFSSDLGEVGLSIVFSQVSEWDPRENEWWTSIGCKLKTRLSEKHLVLGCKITSIKLKRFYLRLTLKESSKKLEASRKPQPLRNIICKRKEVKLHPQIYYVVTADDWTEMLMIMNDLPLLQKKSGNQPCSLYTVCIPKCDLSPEAIHILSLDTDCPGMILLIKMSICEWLHTEALATVDSNKEIESDIWF